MYSIVIELLKCNEWVYEWMGCWIQREFYDEFYDEFSSGHICFAQDDTEQYYRVRSTTGKSCTGEEEESYGDILPCENRCVHMHTYIHTYIRTYIHTYIHECLFHDRAPNSSLSNTHTVGTHRANHRAHHCGVLYSRIVKRLCSISCAAWQLPSRLS